ncbi:MAG: response regulator, partial [Bacteroidales bacterium]|nr:response regulator [Bacteroidales bacterium]
MLKVLVIDDSSVIVDYIKGNLEEAGYEVCTADNGKAGIEMIDKYDLDLVITDIIMPERDGVEVMLYIKRLYPDIRTIVITSGGAIAAKDHLSMASKLGADFVIQKPVDPLQLLATISAIQNPFA